MPASRGRFRHVACVSGKTLSSVALKRRCGVFLEIRSPMAHFHLIGPSVRLALTLGLMLISSVGLSAASRAVAVDGGIFADVETASGPVAKLQAVQPLVEVCDQLRLNRLSRHRKVDDRSGFKADRVERDGSTVVAFGATEGVGQFAAAALEEAKLLAVAARAGGPKLAAVLFMFRAATGSLPEIPPDVRTDFEYLVGARPVQFIQAVDFIRGIEPGPAPIVLTGHSLGGALAAYAAGVESMPAVTFNAPYLNAALRRDRPVGSRGRTVAFETVRESVGGVPRDAIASVTRMLFGADPHVSTVEVRVEAKDLLLHGLEHFMMKPLIEAGLRRVPADGGMRCTLPDGKPMDLEAGSSVLDLGRGGEAMILAVRRGFLHSSTLEDQRTLGRLTVAIVKTAAANLRPDPSTGSPAIVGLPKGLTVIVLDRVRGQDVGGSTDWLRVELMVVKKVKLMDAARLMAELGGQRFQDDCQPRRSHPGFAFARLTESGPPPSSNPSGDFP